MNNNDTQAAIGYHDGTKHPHGALMDPQHRFHLLHQPVLFKRYVGLEPIPLPLDRSYRSVPALSAIADDLTDDDGSAAVPNVETLARVLYYTAGVTRRRDYPWGEVHFRAAACTGALYHIEIYLVCGDLEGLPAGVYHFEPQSEAVTLLRKGDFRGTLVDATGGVASVARAPAVMLFTDVFWRNACKYQAREYRHAFWDSGTMLSHTLALASGAGLPAHAVTGFVDHEVNGLLGLDTSKEVALVMVPVGRTTHGDAAKPRQVAPLSLEVEPISDYEKVFPAILDVHRASSLEDPAQVTSWHGTGLQQAPSMPAGRSVHLRPLGSGQAPGDPVETVVLRRGSTRRFAREAVTFEELSTILDRSLRGVPFDFHGAPGPALNDVYLIVNQVTGLTPGAYYFNGDAQELETLRPDQFRDVAGHLALDQDLAADASVNIYFMAGLGRILDGLGNRGYRAAQLEAAVCAGRMYLAAYAQRLGATGLTFYDDQVTDFFSPHAMGKSVMFLVAVGNKARKS